MTKYTFTSLNTASLLLITYGLVYSSVVNIGAMVEVGKFLINFDTSRNIFFLIGYLLLFNNRVIKAILVMCFIVYLSFMVLVFFFLGITKIDPVDITEPVIILVSLMLVIHDYHTKKLQTNTCDSMETTKEQSTLHFFEFRMDQAKANIMSAFSSLIVTIPMVLIYLYFTGTDGFFSDFYTAVSHFWFWLIPVILIHEISHAVVLYPKYGSDVAGFGINLFVAYCYLKKPVSNFYFRISILAPFLLLTVIPFIFSIILQIEYIFWLSLVHAVMSGGDFIMFYWATVKVKHDAKIFELDGYKKAMGFKILPEHLA